MFPSLKYINHMFTLSTKVTLIHGAHVQAHKAAHCFCALSGGRRACAKHINPPRSKCARKHSLIQAVNYLVHTAANVCRTEGLTRALVSVFAPDPFRTSCCRCTTQGFIPVQDGQRPPYLSIKACISSRFCFSTHHPIAPTRQAANFPTCSPTAPS